MNRCLTGAAFVSWTLAAPAKPRTTNPNQHPATAADTSAYGSGSIPKMLSRMDPSSPPVKRTLHLLKTPDILLANDTAHPSITTWSLTGCPLGHRRLAVSLILLPLALWRREIYKQYSGSRLVACPESQQPAAVSIDVRHAAATGMDGCPDLRLSDCTRWPERSNCDQACLSRAVQAGPYTLGGVKVGTKQIYHLPIVLAAPSIPSPLLRRPARAARQLLHAQGKTDRTNSWPASPLQLTEQQIGQLDAEVAALLDSHRDAVMRLAEVP